MAREKKLKPVVSSFTPDGDFLAILSPDGTVKVLFFLFLHTFLFQFLKWFDFLINHGEIVGINNFISKIQHFLA